MKCSILITINALPVPISGHLRETEMEKSHFICHTICLKGRVLTFNYECQALITVSLTFVNNVM